MMQYAPLKRRSTLRLHGAISQTALVFNNSNISSIKIVFFEILRPNHTVDSLIKRFRFKGTVFALFKEQDGINWIIRISIIFSNIHTIAG
jgi:hypothetical protein